MGPSPGRIHRASGMVGANKTKRNTTPPSSKTSKLSSSSLERPRFLNLRIRRIEMCLLALVLIFCTQFVWVFCRLQRLDAKASSMFPASSWDWVASGSAHNMTYQSGRQVSGSETSTTSRSRESQRAEGTSPSNTNPSRQDNVAIELAPPSPETKQSIKVEAPKRRRRRKGRWDPGQLGLENGPIKLTTGQPIFVASLPKSGTTSIWQYFNCGGHQASHQWVKLNETYSEQSGRCIRRNIDNDRAPFEGCGSHNVYTDTGFALYTGGGTLPNVPTDCYYPSVQALEALYESYPNLTIIQIVRETETWYNSMASWGNGSLLTRWMLCDVPGFPRWGAGAKETMAFYDWHTEHLRRFAREHPSIHFIEVSLESSETGAILEHEIGIPSQCWGDCSPASKFCKKTG